MRIDLCVVCSGQMSSGLLPWHFICGSCGYEKALLDPKINSSGEHEQISETDRETGLYELRKANFEILVRSLSLLRPMGGSLLDVGCAHGWFLESAKKYFNVVGIEPDKGVASIAISKTPEIRVGYFPEALRGDEKFDIITFNDVIEHIPDIDNVLKEVSFRQRSDGLLLLNLPSSRGVFYRASKLLCLMGLNGFFERMWQKSLPSPHVHYFNKDNLVSLMKSRGYEILIDGTLPSLTFRGLFKRIAYAKGQNILINLFLYVVITLGLPFLKILPKDIIFVIAKKKE